MHAIVNGATQSAGPYAAAAPLFFLSSSSRSGSAMRRSVLLFALWLSSSSAIAVAQDYSPRHGFWGEAGLGFGPANFTCDSCDYHRATANNRSQLGGWAFSFGMGGTPSPRLRVGAELSGWSH